jgi:predicted nucleic acid-binding Zn ribbon protein
MRILTGPEITGLRRKNYFSVKFRTVKNPVTDFFLHLPSKPIINTMSYIKHIKEYHCLYCNSTVYGRTDKKFCSEECKNGYYNDYRKRQHRSRISVVRILEQNYAVLENLLAIDVKSVQLDALDALGFQIPYCTYTAVKGTHRIYQCYDIEYRISKKALSGIIRL